MDTSASKWSMAAIWPGEVSIKTVKVEKPYQD
jgi:hypothetical protein